MVCSLSRIRAEISRGTDETPDPGMENPEWCGEWEVMGQTLKEISDMIAWNFPPEQIQNPAEVGKYLKEKCNDDSNEKKLIAICWALAYAYRTLLDTVRQQIKSGGRKINQQTSQLLRLQPNQTDNLSRWQLLLSREKNHKTKTNCPVDDDDDDDKRGGPSKPAIDSEPEITIESLSIKDLRGLRKDYIL
ncbi:hypothetical protein HGM15179_019478 [Zosterops borbonicus]|uniref:Uncharacterized protein n=1 Tax=Zosterops borbonicus TaxID=364589 RepID=A0A8K1FV33_9PASS|nr:hypothetical protein HGM15179_019478 [Zosterops borbonicus]